LNLIYSPLERTELKLFADIGAFTNALSSQIISELNYYVSNTFYFSAGYRFWYIKVPAEQAIYNGSIRGWVVRLGFQF